MNLDQHIKALMEAPTVKIAEAILRLQSELQRRKDAADREHVTLRPE